MGFLSPFGQANTFSRRLSEMRERAATRLARGEGGGVPSDYILQKSALKCNLLVEKFSLLSAPARVECIFHTLLTVET